MLQIIIVKRKQNSDDNENERKLIGWRNQLKNNNNVNQHKLAAQQLVAEVGGLTFVVIVDEERGCR